MPSGEQETYLIQRQFMNREHGREDEEYGDVNRANRGEKVAERLC